MGVEFSCCNSRDAVPLKLNSSTCESCTTLRQVLTESLHSPQCLSTSPPTVMPKSGLLTPLSYDLPFPSGRISPAFPRTPGTPTDSMDKFPTSPSDISSLPSFQPVPKWYAEQIHKHSLVRIKTTSQKFTELKTRLQVLKSHKLIKVERVQNRELFQAFLNSQERVSQKEGGTVTVSELFYGTGKVDPYLLCARQGLDSPLVQTFSRYICCFLEDPKSCLKYMYRTKFGHLQVILCLVLTGQGVELSPEDDLAAPCVPVSTLSVKVKRKNAWIWAVYERERSYPAYILTLSAVE